MKQTFILTLTLFIFLSACGPTPTPALPTPNLEATKGAMVAAMVDATLTAQPSATPAPTETLLPTETPTLPPTETPTPTVTVTATSIPFQGTLVPAGLDGTLPTKAFLIENNTTETLHVSIYGVSEPGEKPVYYEWDVTGPSFSFKIIWGNFQYTVLVGNKKTFTGNFRINNYDKTVMHVYMNKVVITGP
jgi:hypothetical protein